LVESEAVVISFVRGTTSSATDRSSSVLEVAEALREPST
jgi:hypothetical protein